MQTLIKDEKASEGIGMKCSSEREERRGKWEVRKTESQIITRPAWAGFKTAEEGRAKICKFLWQKLKNKSNIEKHIMNNFITLFE